MDREDIPGQTIAHWSRHIRQPGIHAYRRCTCLSPTRDRVLFTIYSFSSIDRKHPWDRRGVLGGMHNVKDSDQRKKVHHLCTRCVNLYWTRTLPEKLKVQCMDFKWAKGIDYESIPFKCQSVMNIGILSHHAQGTKRPTHIRSWQAWVNPSWDDFINYGSPPPPHTYTRGYDLWFPHPRGPFLFSTTLNII